MPAVAESIGFGSTLHVNDGASNAYVQVFNLNTFTPPSEKLNTVESKRLDTPGAVIVKVPTMFDPGECSAKLQFSQAGFARFETPRKAKTKINLKFTVVDDVSTTVVIVPGYVTQNKADAVEPDKITEFEVMFAICGPAS